MKTTKNKGFEWPIYETKRQCAKATGWSLGFLKTIQQMGAPGFRHGRVYLAEVLRWVGSQTISDAAELLDANQELARLRRAQSEAKELELAERRGRLFDRDILEELLWESGLGQMRRMIFESIKTYRRQATAGTAVQIVEDVLPKILGAIRETIASKRAEIDAPVETKSEP